MFIGNTLHADGDTAPANDEVVYYSPWFPRGGNRGRMTCNVIAYGGNINTSTGFEVKVQTKNSEQSDKSAEDGTNPTWSENPTLGSNVETTWIAGRALDDAVNVGLLELVRFKYTFTVGEGESGWVHFRMLQPQWFTN